MNTFVFRTCNFTRFYEEITEKAFSQVNLFIDVLNIMLAKNRFFKLLEVDILFSRHAIAGLLLRTIWLLYLRDNPAVDLMILVAAKAVNTKLI